MCFEINIKKLKIYNMKLAVVGATGMVGEIMLKVLDERNFPYTELILVASEKSVGKVIEFRGSKTHCCRIANRSGQ